MSADIRTAFVMGAGLGTRLRPLTGVKPKPLIPVFGKPLITFALDHLIALGIRSFVVNTHHLADQFAPLAGGYRGCPVRLVHEPNLLETGGGIKNVERWLGGGPFLVYSGDVLTDIDVGALVEEHFRKGNDVTLALRHTGLATGVAVRGDRVVDIGGRHGQPGSVDYANISVWSPGIFERIPPATKIASMPVVADWAAQGGRVGGLVLDGRQWFNIGSRGEYLGVHRAILGARWRPDYLAGADWPAVASPTARLAPRARIAGASSVGDGCVIGEGAVIEDSILWPGARVAAGARLKDCVVAASLVISGEHENVDFTAS